MSSLIKKCEKIDYKINRLQLKKNKLTQRINDLPWTRNKRSFVKRKNRLVIKKNKITWEIEGLVLKRKQIAEKEASESEDAGEHKEGIVCFLKHQLKRFART